jgi:hypothetical protein
MLVSVQTEDPSYKHHSFTRLSFDSEKRVVLKSPGFLRRPRVVPFGETWPARSLGHALTLTPSTSCMMLPLPNGHALERSKTHVRWGDPYSASKMREESASRTRKIRRMWADRSLAPFCS